MVRRFRRAEEAGYALIELVVTSIIIGMIVGVLMPALQGYQTIAQVRVAASEAVMQFRQAQMYSLAQDQQINVLFDPSGDLPSRGNNQGWEFCTTTGSCGFSSTWATTDKPLLRTIVPNTVNITAYCYRGAFTPTGQYLNWTGVCTYPGATVEALCFNAGGSNPSKIRLFVSLATGGVTMSDPVAGACP